jgi:hypothetical protein
MRSLELYRKRSEIRSALRRSLDPKLTRNQRKKLKYLSRRAIDEINNRQEESAQARFWLAYYRLEWSSSSPLFGT